MELKDFVGVRLLSGIDTDILTTNYGESVNAVYFILDGIAYEAVEDPDDGYRSYLSEIQKTTNRIKNTFFPQKLIGKMKENDSYQNNDVIQFYDAYNNKIVLELGTENWDDYYPCCVLAWYPENLSINAGR